MARPKYDRIRMHTSYLLSVLLQSFNLRVTHSSSLARVGPQPGGEGEKVVSHLEQTGHDLLIYTPHII